MRDTSAIPESAPAGPGDNLPPSAVEMLRDDLAERYRGLTARHDELLAAGVRTPSSVDDDETAGKFGDFIKQVTGAIKSAEAARIDEKEPYLEGGRAVDGFFKKIIEPLAKLKKAVEERLNIYQRRKADEERRAREEIASKAREEAEVAAREAAERAKALKTPSDMDPALAAESTATRAAEDAAVAKKAAAAKAADLSRTRGDLGSVASLRTDWTGELEDRALLELEPLREHLTQDCLDKAIRAYAKAGGRQLTGARIWQRQQTVVR
ncbi:MAG TPA: hypothetical protein ENH55_13420 [Aurantimonas coralicida]|uniref:Uncharacterized protein n=2 Tax=root TaxID=1 RepID=A0A9C9TFS2_9HYPH|nr:hypothetical protein [Aurantimonas coralicida]HET99639.1 hypothetical protein [Aurantimonas coralicida]